MNDSILDDVSDDARKLNPDLYPQLSKTKQPTPQRTVAQANRSFLERKFLTIWRQLGGPEPEAIEYRFHNQRRFRFDYAWPSKRIAIEVEGGTWQNGRHSRPMGYASDCIKYNLAQLDGWKVYRFTTDMLSADPDLHLTPVIMDLLDNTGSN